MINDDVDLLEHFAANSSNALQTARRLGRENRVFQPLAILQKIGDYALGGQVAGMLRKMIQCVLTGHYSWVQFGFQPCRPYSSDKESKVNLSVGWG